MLANSIDGSVIFPFVCDNVTFRLQTVFPQITVAFVLKYIGVAG